MGRRGEGVFGARRPSRGGAVFVIVWAGVAPSFDLRSSPVAMRPAGGLPVMSNRAKRVLIALVGLAVAAIVWFLFVGVYVDWLWFGEVGFREVVATRAVTRIVL